MNRLGTPQRLGELLVARGLISDGQLEQVLREQTASHEFLGNLLLRKGWVGEEDLLKALSQQYGIPFVSLQAEKIDWSLGTQIPSSLLVHQGCFPIQMDEQSITVAISNPLDVWVESELEKVARGRALKLVLATRSEIRDFLKQSNERALRRVYRKKEEK